MDSGLIALIVAPALAFAGVIVGKIIDRRRNEDDAATSLIRALQTEIDRRDKIDGERRAEHRAETSLLQGRLRVLEDYSHRLRRALMAAGLDVPEWPAEVAAR
jgi:LPS sulfotransferase NodH